jgi:hypothetical protein
MSRLRAVRAGAAGSGVNIAAHVWCGTAAMGKDVSGCAGRSPWQNSVGMLRFPFRHQAANLREICMKKEIKKKRYGKKKRRKQS